ncbi:MAG: aldo/keto reductase, partial [Bacteroidota bacterium]
YWGTSEWDATEILEAISIAQQHNLIGPVMEQPQYNMLTRQKLERDYMHLFRYHGLGTTIWSPLASGVLSGKYNDASPDNTRLSMAGMEWLHDRVIQDEILTKTRKLKSVADSIGMTQARMSLAWCLKNPNVSTVILGASNVKQLQENLHCLDAINSLTPEIMQSIESILENKPVTEGF